MLLGIRLLETTCWCGLSNYQAATAQMHLVETKHSVECRRPLGTLSLSRKRAIGVELRPRYNPVKSPFAAIKIGQQAFRDTRQSRCHRGVSKSAAQISDMSRQSARKGDALKRTIVETHSYIMYIHIHMRNRKGQRSGTLLQPPTPP